VDEPEIKNAVERDEHGRVKPGSGSLNPGGRPKALAEVQRLARQYGPRAVERLVELLELPLPENSKVVLGAATALLDRGFGKPAQTVRLEDEKGTGLEDLSESRLIDLLERQLAALKARSTQQPAQEPPK
jgi:hypothetical protein